MTSSAAGGPSAPASATLLRQVMSGYLVPQLLYTAARLGVADALASGPRRLAGLAEECGSDPDALRRCLRALAAIGVVTLNGEDVAELGPLGEGLRTSATETALSSVLMAGAEMYHAWGSLLHSVRTGTPAFDHVYGGGWYEYLDAHPETAAVFSRSMRETDDQGVSSVADAYDFRRAATVVDVGGAPGSLLIAVLRAWPHLRGLVFDRPAVVEGARDAIAAAGLDHRCQVAGGDMFRSVPAGSDVYILARTLLNVDSTRARTVLEVCAAAMTNTSRLLVIEPVLREEAVSLGDALNDLHLLVMGGGRMCTRPEFERMFRAAGLTLKQSISTSARLSILEVCKL